jgi:hypothetical protein
VTAMALLGESLRAAEFNPREAREQTGNPAIGDSATRVPPLRMRNMVPSISVDRRACIDIGVRPWSRVHIGKVI